MRRYINIKKYLLVVFLVLAAGLLTNATAQEKADKKQDNLNLLLTVLDDQGNPVEDALVRTNEIIRGFSGEDGTLSVVTPATDFVTVTKQGFADFSMVAEKLKINPAIKLKSQPLYMATGDDVYMPFLTFKKRHSTSGTSVISGSDLEKYPTTDIRNSFTGLATGLQVQERNGAPGLQAEEKLALFGVTDKIRLYTRGRSPIYIIDDVPTDVTEMQIEQQEIETVTVIKDIAAKAMYGPQAANGIIFIRTHRGKAGQNLLKFNAETGISVIDRFPEWTLGADYARLNNQARLNSGMDLKYSDAAITAYSRNDAYDKLFPSINFRDMMLKNTMAMRRLNVSYEGGKESVRFFTFLGYSGEDDIFKIGPQADNNRLNARSNLDIGINELLSIHLNIVGGFTIRRSPNYGYDPQYGADGSSDETMDILEFNRLIGDITSISPIAFPVYANYDSISNTPWFGVDPIFTRNPIGELTGNGYYTEYGRSGATNISLDYDMKNITNGLRSKTFFSFDIFNLIRTGKAEQYIAYNVIPSKTAAGADTVLLTKAHDGSDMAGQAKLHDYYYQRFGGYQSFTYNKELGSNTTMQSALTFYLSKVSRNQVKEPERQQSLVLSALFTRNNKYMLQGVLNYSGSSSLSPEKRYALFPSVGLGWILSEEDFLAGASFLNFLKLRGEAGILGYEGFNPPFYYRDMWSYNTSGSSFGAAPTGYWFGSDTEAAKRSNPGRIGNPNIGWEKRKEITVGMDASLFNHKLTIELNYYNNLRDGILTSLDYSVPYATGVAAASTYANHNKYRYTGVEGSVNYTSKLGNLRYSVGGWGVVQDSRILKYDEPDYRFDYQSRVGKPVDAFWGHTYLGKFASDAETGVVPQLFDETLAAGDLKYKDMNGDGKVDDNDRTMVGRTSPRLIYALNVKLNYKNFDLTMIADGRAFVDMPMTNSYYRNGWGDNVYSAFVRDNIGGAYPRLTYYQVSNNFQNSDFWLTKGGYFKLQNVELAYNLSPRAAQSLSVRGVRLFVRGANLLTISGVKDVDPESPESGVDMYPLFRTFTAGLNLTF